MVRTEVPLIPASGPDIAAFLVGHGVRVDQVDVDATEDGNPSFTVVDADRDVTALLADYAAPPAVPKARDKIQAALQGRNYGEALSRLLAAISLPDD